MIAEQRTRLVAVGGSEQSALQVARSRLLDALAEGSREGLVLVSAGGSVDHVAVGEDFAALLGYSPDALAERVGPELIHAADLARLSESLGALRVQGASGARKTFEFRARHRAGHYVLFQATAVNRLDDELVGAVVIHAWRATSAGPESAGSIPSLPMPDRPMFIQRLQEAVERSKAEGDYGFSVLIVELERLKMLVGSFGQGVVDELLGEVAKRIERLLRPQDFLSRFGGGEFAVLLDGVGDRRRAARVADRIQKTVGFRYQLADQAVNTSGIVGISTSERAYDHAEQVIRDASLAANRARVRSKKRRAVFQTQMRVEDTRFMSMVSELHNAIGGEQLELHYQPVVSLEDGSVRGFEALLRWRHPTLGLISPDQFIPIAEETGLIIPLGQWVLQKACHQMAGWHHAFGDHLYVAVNLSAKQLADDELPKHVEEAIFDSGLDPRSLVFELTETAVLENREQATQILNKLKERGVRVSLDDFGTGYSSFSYLHQLPYDTLKIDRSFISQLGQGDDNSEIVHAIIVLAHNLRMSVVAEGVETPEQAEILTGMGCEYAQGFHFAKPLDAEATEQLLSTAKAR